MSAEQKQQSFTADLSYNDLWQDAFAVSVDIDEKGHHTLLKETDGQWYVDESPFDTALDAYKYLKNKLDEDEAELGVGSYVTVPTLDGHAKILSNILYGSVKLMLVKDTRIEVSYYPASCLTGAQPIAEHQFTAIVCKMLINFMETK